MQASGQSSKPLALVIIGLILGASLGLGSGYAIFYPQMVRENNQTVEDRVREVEDSLAAMNAQMANLNSSIADIKGSLGTILILSQTVNALGTRIAALEISMSQVNGRIAGLDEDMGALEEDFAALRADWVEALGGFSDVKSEFQAVNTRIDDAQDKVSQTLAVGRLSAYLAYLPQANVAVLTDALHAVLMAENAVYSAWARAYGEATAKILLTPVLDGKMGKMVWNRVAVTKVSGNVYQVRLETYTGLEFVAAGVTVPKIRLEARANVNVVTGELAAFSWAVVDIV